MYADFDNIKDKMTKEELIKLIQYLLDLKVSNDIEFDVDLWIEEWITDTEETKETQC